jgi:OOP family OmpA-OmpF porin
MKFKNFTLILAMLFSASLLNAQDSGDSTMMMSPSDYKTWNLGLDLGISKSYGDIRQYNFNPSFQEQGDLSYNFGLHLTKSLSPVFGVKARFSFSQLGGSLIGRDPVADDTKLAELGANIISGAIAQEDAVYYDANVYSGSLNLIVNFSNLGFFKRQSTKPRKWLFYGMAGIGVMNYDTELKYLLAGSVNPAKQKDAVLVPNRIVSQENEDLEAIFPAGLGIKYNVSPRVDIGFEGNYVLTTTDVLDGVALTPSSVDKYGTLGFTVNFKLGKQSGDLLEWSNPREDMFAKIDALEEKINKVDEALTDHINKADTDGDGIPDVNDKEPYSLFGAEVDSNGMSKDSDGDGVPDGLDKEPDTPKGELVNFQGMAIKSSSTPTEGTGGLTEKDVTNAILTDGAYFPSVFFVTNSAQVRSTSMEQLVRVAIAMQKNPDLKVSLTGHADKRGSESYNEKLATRRAEAVKSYLVRNLGIDASRVSTVAKGEVSPLSPTMYSINRRVDIQGM